MIVGEAFVKIRPDGRGFSQEAERSLLGGISSFAKKAGVVFAAGFITDKAIKGIVESVGLASDLTESVSKVGVVFGESADAVERFAANAPTALGQTEAQALAATGTFGNLLRSVGLTEQKSADFSTTMVGLASDLASFNNTDPAEALDALRAGLVGETEPLKRFGININEALLKQEALTLGLASGKGELSSAAKVQAAYSLIMKQSTLAQGDFARTSGGLANQQRILKASADQAKTAFGAGLLPVLERLSPVVGDALTALIPFAENLGRGLGVALTGTVDGVSAVIDVIGRLRSAASGESPLAALATELGAVIGWSQESPQVDAMTTAFTGMRDVGTDLRDRLIEIVATVGDLMPTVEELTDLWRDQRDVLLPLSTALGTFVASFVLLNQVSSTIAAVRTGFALLGPALSTALAPLLANPVTLIIAGIVALGAALFVAYKKVEPFRNVVDAVARTIRDKALAAFDLLRTAFIEAGDVVESAKGVILGFVREIAPAVSRVMGAVGSVISGIVGTVSGVVAGIAQFGRDAIAGLDPLVAWMQEHLFPVFIAAGDFVDALGDRIRNVMQVISTVTSFAFGVISDAASAAWSVISAVIGGISELVSGVFTTVWKVAGPIVIGVLKAIGIGLRTAASVATQVLGGAFEALGAVVKIVFAGIKAVVETALGVLRGIFTVFAGILRGDFGKVWEGLVTIVRAPLDAVGKFVRTAFDAIVQFVSGLPARIAAIGSALFTGLIDQARNVLSTLVGVVSGGFAGVLEFLTGLPSSVAGSAANLFGSIVDAATGLPGLIGEQLAKIPGLVLGLVETLAQAGIDLGAGLLGGIISGLSGLADEAGDLVGDLGEAVKGIAVGLVNSLIDGINNLIPNEIGAIKVAGREIFGGIDLPDRPIPRVQLARGDRVRARPGGVNALLAEGGWDELVLSTNPAMARRNAGLLSGTGMADPALLARMVDRVEQIAAVPRVGQLTLATASPQRHALEFLGALDDAAWLGGS